MCACILLNTCIFFIVRWIPRQTTWYREESFSLYVGCRMAWTCDLPLLIVLPTLFKFPLSGRICMAWRRGRTLEEGVSSSLNVFVLQGRKFILAPLLPLWCPVVIEVAFLPISFIREFGMKRIGAHFSTKNTYFLIKTSYLSSFSFSYCYFGQTNTRKGKRAFSCKRTIFESKHPISFQSPQFWMNKLMKWGRSFFQLFLHFLVTLFTSLPKTKHTLRIGEKVYLYVGWSMNLWPPCSKWHA